MVLSILRIAMADEIMMLAVWIAFRVASVQTIIVSSSSLLGSLRAGSTKKTNATVIIQSGSNEDALRNLVFLAHGFRASLAT